MVQSAAKPDLLACAGDAIGSGISSYSMSCRRLEYLHVCLTFARFLLPTGAQVQSQPPVPGLVPYGDDD